MRNYFLGWLSRAPEPYSNCGTFEICWIFFNIFRIFIAILQRTFLKQIWNIFIPLKFWKIGFAWNDAFVRNLVVGTRNGIQKIGLRECFQNILSALSASHLLWDRLLVSNYQIKLFTLFIQKLLCVCCFEWISKILRECKCDSLCVTVCFWVCFLPVCVAGSVCECSWLCFSLTVGFWLSLA